MADEDARLSEYRIQLENDMSYMDMLELVIERVKFGGSVNFLADLLDGSFRHRSFLFHHALVVVAAGLIHSRDTPNYEKFHGFAGYYLDLKGNPEEWPQQLLAAAFTSLYARELEDWDAGRYLMMSTVPFTDEDVKNAGHVGPDNALEMAFYPLGIRARRMLPDTPLPGDEAFGAVEPPDEFSYYTVRTEKGMLAKKK